ncbi:MAG: site-specific integrase [Lysinibacillus sp.]|nr:site-specific integrase [Lysinibacillus sp.]
MSYVRKLEEKNKYQLVADLGYRGKRRLRKTKIITAKNEKEAERQLILFEAELKQKEELYFGETANITLNELYPRWKEHYAKQHYSPRTFVDNCTHLEKRILPIFGDMKLRDIKKVDIAFFISDLQKKNKRLDGLDGNLAPSTIRNIYKAFASIMRAAVEWDLIDESPCRNIKLPKLKYEEGKAYSEKEVALLFERLKQRESPEKRIMVELAIVSASRQGEIAALEAKHLNPQNNSILIEQSLAVVKKGEFEEAVDGMILKETKGKRKRVVTIPKNVMDDLLRLATYKQYHLGKLGLERQWKEHVFLFSNENGKPYRPDSISQWWERFMDRNPDLPRIRFHDLRHTSATLLIHAGEHPKVIQSRLGHANISTTLNVYGHLLKETDQRASSHFEKFFIGDEEKE